MKGKLFLLITKLNLKKLNMKGCERFDLLISCCLVPVYSTIEKPSMSEMFQEIQFNLILSLIQEKLQKDFLFFARTNSEKRHPLHKDTK